MALKKARRLVAKASALCPEGREEAGEGQAGAVGIIKPQHEAAIDALLAGEESDSDGQEGEEEEGEEEGEEEEESEGSEDDNRGRGGRQGEPQAGRVEGKKGSGGRGGGKYGFSFDDAGGDEDDEDEDGDGGLEAMLAQRSDSDDLDTHSGSELEEGEGEEDEGQGEKEDEDEDGHFGFRGAAGKAAAQGAGSRLGGDKKGVVGVGKGRQGEEQGRRPGEDRFLRLQEMEAFLEDSERQHSAQLAKQEGSAGAVSRHVKPVLTHLPCWYPMLAYPPLSNPTCTFADPDSNPSQHLNSLVTSYVCSCSPRPGFKSFDRLYYFSL
ncbi:hypothetical protein V8C86DRAFT_659148 [Haematococcus lacustris]